MAALTAIVNRAERRRSERAAECIEGEQYRSRANESRRCFEFEHGQMSVIVGIASAGAASVDVRNNLH